MAAISVTPADIRLFVDVDEAKAAAMIADALAMARLVAPCLAGDNLTDDQAAAAKAIIRSAIVRWHTAGDGGVTQQQQSVGGVSIGATFDNRQSRRGVFWPSEIEQLQDICRLVNGDAASGAFTVDTAPGIGSAHVPWCSVMWGAYCSCGVDLTNGQYPIYELD